MGRVILIFNTGKSERLKCKDQKRAEQIARKRPNVREFHFYKNNERIPPAISKKKPEPIPSSFEELENMMKRQGLLY